MHWLKYSLVILNLHFKKNRLKYLGDMYMHQAGIKLDVLDSEKETCIMPYSENGAMMHIEECYRYCDYKCKRKGDDQVGGHLRRAHWISTIIEITQDSNVMHIWNMKPIR